MFSIIQKCLALQTAPGWSSPGSPELPLVSRCIQSWPMRWSSRLDSPHLLWALIVPQGCHLESTRYAQLCPGGCGNNNAEMECMEFSKQVLLPVEKWCITGCTEMLVLLMDVWFFSRCQRWMEVDQRPSALDLTMAPHNCMVSRTVGDQLSRKCQMKWDVLTVYKLKKVSVEA